MCAGCLFAFYSWKWFEIYLRWNFINSRVWLGVQNRVRNELRLFFNPRFYTSIRRKSKTSSIYSLSQNLYVCVLVENLIWKSSKSNSWKVKVIKTRPLVWNFLFTKVVYLMWNPRPNDSRRQVYGDIDIFSHFKIDDFLAEKFCNC